MTPRWQAVGGIAGPVGFIAAWTALGSRRAGYSPVHDPISRLAAVGAPTRPAMTAGFASFAVGVAAFSAALREGSNTGASRAAMATAVGTVALAALPLGAPRGDAPHAAAAGIAYVALAATPVLGARSLAARGSRRAAASSVACGIAIAAALTASTVLPSHRGLAQRLGLTIGDLWFMATAIGVLRRRA